MRTNGKLDQANGVSLPRPEDLLGHSRESITVAVVQWGLRAMKGEARTPLPTLEGEEQRQREMGTLQLAKPKVSRRVERQKTA